MKNYILFLLTLIFSLTTFASDTINTAAIFTGGKVYKNYVMNPNCNYNVLNLTVSALTVGKNSSDTGQAVCSWNPGANSATLDILVNNRDSDAVSNAQVGKNCKASFDYEASGAAGGYSAYLTIDGTQVSPTVDLKAQNSLPGYWEAVYPCPTSATSAVKIHVVTDASGTIPRFKWWHASYSRYEGPSSDVNSNWVNAGANTIGSTGTSPTKGVTSVDRFLWRRVGTNMEFRMEYAQSATTGSSKGSGDYLYTLPASTGCTIDSSKVTFYTGTTTGGIANTIGSAVVNSSTASQPAVPIAYDSTHFRILAAAGSTTTNYVGGGSTWYDTTQTTIGWEVTGSVPCVGWAPQTAQTPDQTNYDWTPTVPVFTGLGTVTITNPQDCQQKRDAADLLYRCKFTGGTATATEMRVSLPGSLVIDSGRNPSIKKCGDATTSFAASGYFGTHVLCEPNVGYVTFGNQGTAATGLTKILGNALGNTITYSIDARIPIQGWYENQKAATLNGSVNTSLIGPGWVEAVSFGGTTEPSVCSSSPCTMYRNTPGITSVTRTGAGLYTVNFASGTFSSPPVCTSQHIGFSLSGWTQRITGTVPTTTTYKIQTIVNSTTGDGGAVDVICFGAH